MRGAIIRGNKLCGITRFTEGIWDRMQCLTVCAGTFVFSWSEAKCITVSQTRERGERLEASFQSGECLALHDLWSNWSFTTVNLQFWQQLALLVQLGFKIHNFLNCRSSTWRTSATCEICSIWQIRLLPQLRISSSWGDSWEVFSWGSTETPLWLVLVGADSLACNGMVSF